MRYRTATIAIILLLSCSLFGQIQSPEDFFGFRPGADYKLEGWDQIVTYFRLLDSGSDKLQVTDLGKSTQGNPFIMAIISSEDNINRLDEIKTASRRFADPRGLSEDQARTMAESGKIVVLITCSLHATEVGAAQMAPELAFDLITRDTALNRQILDNVVFLLVPSFNPDGLIMVKEWYDQNLETEFEGSSMPWLYQLYTGHDNNRDAIMLTQVESQLVTKVLFQDWHPPVYLDMHQMGNRGSRIFVPPFIDPLNPNIDPLVVREIALFGESMALDLESVGKAGAGTSHSFTAWWQGCFLMSAWWRNVAGLLTEMASCRIATPIFQTKDDLTGGGRGFAEYQKRVNFPNPWPGGWWRLRDIVEYDFIAAKSVLETAAKNREKLLLNRYRMGKKAVEAGRNEPPYAVIIPPNQRDRATALKMVDVLIQGGVEIHRAKADFTADGITHHAGSHVILMAQPFRAFVKDLLEPQAYPDIRESEGGPPIQPYDAAGWTLSMQMGIHTTPAVNPFDADLEKVNAVTYPPTRLPGRSGAGYVLNHAENQHVIAVNRLLKQGARIFWAKESVSSGGQSTGPGAVLIPSRYRGVLETAVKDLSLTIQPLDHKPAGDVYQLKPVRLGMYQPWTSSMHEGWSRWILEQYGFPYNLVHDAEIRAGNLADRYDVIYIPDIQAEGILKGREEGTAPPRYTSGIGSKGLTNLKQFVEAGGALIVMDSASDLVIGEFGLPVANTLKKMDRKQFYCPGSILASQFDTSHPVAYGMNPDGACFFARSPAYKVIPNFQVKADVVAKYPARHILKSGYLLGEEAIANKASVVDVPVGKGRVILIGFDALNRTYAHATYQILFNAIFYGGATTAQY